MEIFNELPAATQLLDAFNVLRENSRTRDRWEARVQQWREARIMKKLGLQTLELTYTVSSCHNRIHLRCYRPPLP